MVSTITLHEPDAVVEIKKHSSLVQMSNVSSLLERKTMNALIRIAKDMLKRYENARVFQCDIGLIRRLTGIKDSSNEDLKKALINLKRMELEYNVLNKDEKSWGIFSFLSEVNIRESGRGKSTMVTFEFPITVLNVIINPSMYVKLNLIIIAGLESKHSVALYEAIKDYQNLRQYRCSLINFRKLMGIKEGQYKIFTMLKKRVLERAVEEINEKTDLSLSFEIEKEGRKVTAIKFKSTPRQKRISSIPAELENRVTHRLKQLGINSGMIVKLKRKHDLTYLLANAEVVLKQAEKKKISNPTGYLLKALQNDFRPVQIEQPTIDEPRILSNENDASIPEPSIQKQIDDITSNRDKDKLLSVKEMFIATIQEKNLMNKVYESKGFDHPIIQGYRLRHLQEII